MSQPFGRARLVAVASAAFLGGLVFASAFDLTPFGYAQQRSGASATQLAKPAPQIVQPLNEASNAFVSIAEHVTPAVVSIQTKQQPRRPTVRRRGQVPPGFEEFFDQFGDPNQRRAPVEGAGSGFIVSSDGYILTNNHVVADADQVTVGLQDKRVFSAKVVGRDPSTDVAVLKIDAGNNLPTLALGNDQNARVGEWVLAIGNPLSLDFTVTAGIISAKNRSGSSLRGLYESRYAIVDYIQTDAAINPGNSGGPLVNSRGEVIGINSAIASQTGLYSGYGFAIPITLAKDVMDDIIKHGHVRRPVLGISITDPTPEDAQSAGLKEIRGAIVQGFSPPDGSPAKRAGLEPGDVIVAINGHPIDRVSTLQRLVRGMEPGQTIGVEVMRYGARKTFRVKLAEASDDMQVASADRQRTPAERAPSYDKLGITVEPVSAELVQQARLSADQRGVVVTDVSTDGPAYQRLLSGDIILEVLGAQRQRIRSVSDFDNVLAKARPGDVVSLHVLSLAQDGSKVTHVVNVRVGS